MDIDRNLVKDALSKGVVQVKFTKSNGEERVMRCTTNEFEISIEKLPKGTGPRHTDEVQRVFDVDKQEWRSFRWDSVIEIKE
jgi:hypothetical protein